MNDESVTPSQKSLCAKIETKAVAGLHSDASLSRHKRAHLETSSLVRGSRPPPRHTCRARSSTSVFNGAPACQCGYAVHLWRRSPDRWGDQTLACCGGGDRVLRHNAVRNVLCNAVSQFTSATPELEKPGLILPPAPPPIHALPTWLTNSFWTLRVGVVPRTFGSLVGSRGLPSLGMWISRPPSARRLSPPDPTFSPQSRRGFQDTRDQVKAIGAACRPLVIEACGGGWAPVLREVVSWISAESSPLPENSWPRSSSGQLHSASLAPFIGETRVQS